MPTAIFSLLSESFLTGKAAGGGEGRACNDGEPKPTEFYGLITGRMKELRGYLLTFLRPGMRGLRAYFFTHSKISFASFFTP